MDIISNIDQQILLFFNGYHTSFLDEAMALITSKWIWIPFYLFLIELLFKRRSPKVAILTLIAVALAITLTDQTCASLIRPYVGRLRPCNPENPIFSSITLVKNIQPRGFSWPSCHAANTFALATLLSCVMKSRKFTIFIFAWAVIVSVSRLYVGVHYPTDLLCGAIIGSLLGYLSLVIVNYLSTGIPRLYSAFLSRTRSARRR